MSLKLVTHRVGFLAGLLLAILAVAWASYAHAARDELDSYLDRLVEGFAQHGLVLKWREVETESILSNVVTLHGVSLVDTRTHDVTYAKRLTFEDVSKRDGDIARLGAIDAEELSRVPGSAESRGWSIKSLRITEPDPKLLEALLDTRGMIKERTPKLMELLGSQSFSMRNLVVDQTDIAVAEPYLAIAELDVVRLSREGIESVAAKSISIFLADENRRSRTAEVKLSDITYGDVPRNFARFGEDLPILTLLSSFSIKQLDILGTSVEDSSTVTTIERIWSRYHPRAENAFAFTEVAVDGWDTRPTDDNPMKGLIVALLPPDGRAIGDFASRFVLDADNGFASLEFGLRAQNFLNLSTSISISGLPDTTLGELKRYREIAYRTNVEQGPVLEALLISIEDVGGLDLIFQFVSSLTSTVFKQSRDGKASPKAPEIPDKTFDPARMRASFADSITKKISELAELEDEQTKKGYKAFRDFILAGGTLTVSIDDRVPLGDWGQKEGEKLKVKVPFIIRHSPPS